MLYLTFDSVTTFMLPYFIGMVYFAIACWVKSEISVVATSTSPAIRPEQVFNLLEEIAPVAELINPPSPKKRRSKSNVPSSIAA
jgi:hypothetical protein